MRKLGKFFKSIFRFFTSMLIGIFLIICLLFAGLFALIEIIFRTGRRFFVSILVGIAEGCVNKRKTLPLVNAPETMGTVKETS